MPYYPPNAIANATASPSAAKGSPVAVPSFVKFPVVITSPDTLGNLTILSAVGKTTQYDNVFPLLVASNAMSKAIIETAINDLAKTVPQAKRIRVSLIH